MGAPEEAMLSFFFFLPSLVCLAAGFYILCSSKNHKVFLKNVAVSGGLPPFFILGDRRYFDSVTSG